MRIHHLKAPLAVLTVALTAATLIACTQPSAPAPQQTATPSSKAPAAAATGWEQQWNSTLARARNEGTVNVYASWSPKVRTALAAAFNRKFGLNAEFTPLGSGSAVVAKAETEMRSGLFVADAFGAGNPSLLNTLKPAGLLQSMKPVLVLPEVTDGKVWLTGSVPFTDDEGMAISMIGNVQRTVVYNTSLVQEGEITSYKDLLKPQYKGKITLRDPSITGSGNAVVSHLGHSVWSEAEAVDFLRKLLRDQQAVLQRDYRLQVESVARGKYSIALAPQLSQVAEFIEVGAPLKFAMVEEDNRMTAEAGALAMPVKPAHPNAAAVFVNWLLTKEGQSIFAPNFGGPSTRTDASREGINPILMPIAGKKYFGESVDALAARAKWLELAKKVMDETVK